MKDNKNINHSQQNIPTDDGNMGRFKEKNPEYKKDISHIDQQEGHLDHGTTGTGTDTNKNKENDKP